MEDRWRQFPSSLTFPAMPYRLAIVEDQHDEQALLERGLTRRGFTVAAYGERASARTAFLVGRIPDLAILDINLNRDDPTDRDGFKLCREMAAIPATAEVPVIFLTDIQDHQTELDGLTLAHDYVRKPVNLALLEARIHNLLEWSRRHRGGSSDDWPVIECGELHIDRNSNRALWKGADLELSYNEFEILHTIGEKCGKVALYRDMFDALGSDEISENTIATHIKNIRKKFRRVDESFPGRGVIRSVPKRGYRWDTPPDGES